MTVAQARYDTRTLITSLDLLSSEEVASYQPLARFTSGAESRP